MALKLGQRHVCRMRGFRGNFFCADFDKQFSKFREVTDNGFRCEEACGESGTSRGASPRTPLFFDSVGGASSYARARFHASSLRFDAGEACA
eukprot:5892391-Prymnesium_polylepis.1